MQAHLAHSPCTLSLHAQPTFPHCLFATTHRDQRNQWELQKSPPSPYKALPALHARFTRSPCTLTPPNPPQLTLPPWLCATIHREQSSSPWETHSSPPSPYKALPPLHTRLAHSHPNPPPRPPFPIEFVPPPTGNKAAANRSRTAAPHPHMKLFPPCTLTLHTHLADSGPLTPPSSPFPLGFVPPPIDTREANGSCRRFPHPHMKLFPPCTLTLHTRLAHSPPNPQPSPFPLGFVQGSSQWELQNSPTSPYEALPPLHTHLARLPCTLTSPPPLQATFPY